MARGRRRLLRRRRRVPHELPLPADAAHVHGGRSWRTRFPIVDILRADADDPRACQWATFLRNHDELTLEMVTDEDRDYMYRVYAAERTARINLGIRRRLAPLLGVRRKIELMNALLLSLPGTPVLYYGDEIGMGDNIYLGDRDGVRTPMQWSADRNAGFSRANPQKLYLPIDHRSRVPLRGDQRRGAAGQPVVAAVVDEAPASRCARSTRSSAAARSSSSPATTRACSRSCASTRASACSWSRTCRASCRAPSSTSQALKGTVPRRAVRPHAVPRDRRGAVLHVARRRTTSTGSALEQAAAPRSPRPARARRAARPGPRCFEPRARGRSSRARCSQYAADAALVPRQGAHAQERAASADVVPLGEPRFAIVLFAIEYDEGNPETYVVPLAFAEDERAARERAGA